jgi:phospholipid transport system substrate-binding protein
MLLTVALLLVGVVLWTTLRPTRHDDGRTLSLPPAGSSPIADLEKSNAALKKLLATSAPSLSSEHGTKRAEAQKIVWGVFDFEELVRRALASHWDEISPEQRTEFVVVSRDLIERNLSKQVQDHPNYDLRFTKETISGSESSVEATLDTWYEGRRIAASLECKLLYKGDRWLVYDVITDEQNMLENYRAEFNKIITNESFDVLLKRMKKRLEKTK